jgi:hypothetical protein
MVKESALRMTNPSMTRQTRLDSMWMLVGYVHEKDRLASCSDGGQPGCFILLATYAKGGGCLRQHAVRLGPTLV